MNVVSINRKKVVLELTPLELSLVRNGMVREKNFRKKQWNTVEPKFPEELMYHIGMVASSEEMASDLTEMIKKYQQWGILK